MAPVSSRRLDIRPLNRAVKKESGTQVNVCRDVENLKQILHRCKAILETR